MAESNIMGLFANPEDIRQKQRERLLNEGRQSAGMLMQGGGSGLSQAIKGYGANVAQYMPLQADRMKRGLMGAAAEVAGLQGNEEGRRAIQLAAMSPQEQEAIQGRQVMKEAASGDPESMQKAIDLLDSRGQTGAANAMRERVKKAKMQEIYKNNPLDDKNPADSLINLGKALTAGGFENEGTQMALKGVGMRPKALTGKDRYLELSDGSYMDLETKKVVEGTQIEEEFKPQSTIGKILSDKGYSPDDPNWNTLYDKEQERQDAQDLEESAAAVGESSFMKQYGKETATALVESSAAVTNANQSLRTLNEMETLLDDEIFTGATANFELGLAKIADAIGVGGKDAAAKAANTEAYVAASAQQTLDILGSGDLGAGTGISDNDRKFARQMAAGEITLTADSIRQIVALNRRVAVNVVAEHNRKVTEANDQFGADAPLRFYEGATATGPDGAKMIYTKGEWKVMNG